MELVARYAPNFYFFVFYLVLVITGALSGIVWLLALFKKDITAPTLLTTYGFFTNALFWSFSATSTIIGIFVLLATVMQLAVLDIHENTEFKLEKQKRAFGRGLLMFLANTCVAAGAWMLTFTSQNLELGSPLFSMFFLVPFAMGALMMAAGALFWHSPPVRSYA